MKKINSVAGLDSPEFLMYAVGKRFFGKEVELHSCEMKFYLCVEYHVKSLP